MNAFHHNQPMAVASTCLVDRASLRGLSRGLSRGRSRDLSRDGAGLVGSTWKPSIHTWEGDSATEVKVTRH